MVSRMEAPARRISLRTNLLLFGGALLVALMVIDRLAGRVVPPVPPPQVANPPNFVEQRNTLEYSYEFRTNSMGLRYRELPLGKARPDEFRTIVLGDSITEGMGVQSADRFTERLEETLSTDRRPMYFINAGLGGRGPLEYGRVLFAVGLRYHPDFALIVVHANDLVDTLAEADLDVRPDGRGGFVVASQRLWEPQGIVHTLALRLMPWAYRRLQYLSMQRDTQDLKAAGFLAQVEERARRLHIPETSVQAWKARVPEWLMKAAEEGRFNGSAIALGLFTPDHWVNNLDIESAGAIAKWTAMQRILSDIIARCKETRLPCALVYTPTTVQYDPSAGSLERAVGIRVRPEWLIEQSELERRLERWAASLHVPYLSVTGDFRKAAAEHPGSLSFTFDRHWNPNGHRVATTAIAAWLRQQRLVPTN